ncbi:MAG TPA: TlpA disulfide reductase family protein [Bacteroidales bacterium]|nr:TlpA disulfide reductase family protein [Bacteroidales bacterium]
MRIKKSTCVFVSLVIVLSACSGRKSDKTAEEGNLSASTLVASNVTTGIEVGQRAPELSFKSPEGKEISLSSLRGKIVLIDFWASWCGPCRMENPNVVNVYKKYSDKRFTRGNGFTIYSVSLDTDKSAWTNGIKTDGLLWQNHVSDLQGWNSAPAALYKVQAIPTNFLIDSDGIIIATNLRSEALGQMMESLLR